MRALRAIAELQRKGELVDEEATGAVLRAASRARRRDAPRGAHAELHAGDVAELLDQVLSPELRRQLAEVELAEACTIVVVAIGWFLGVPIRVIGGMFDRNATDREIGGNGWGQLAGVIRGRETYGASNVRKRFAERAELWIGVEHKIKADYTNRRTRTDGSHYESTGRRYTKHHGRKWLYWPAEVYRVVTGMKLCREITRALFAVPHRTPAYRVIRSWRKLATPKRQTLRKRDLDFWSVIAWSRAEQEAWQRLQNKALPRTRVRALAESISIKDPPKGESSIGRRHGRRSRGALLPSRKSGDGGGSPSPSQRPRSSDAGQEGRAEHVKRPPERPQIVPEARSAPPTGPPSSAVVELAAELGGNLDNVRERIALEELEAERRWRRRPRERKGSPL